jgi:hypothetical protein
MTEEELQLLAEYRKHYKYATLEDYILVGGVLYNRCRVCGKNPIPQHAGSVRWCDPCVDEFLDGREPETMEEFIERKREEASKPKRVRGTK